MREIKRKVKIPFQKIEYTTELVNLREMDELESLIMVLIVSAREISLRTETLGEALKLKYNIDTHTHPLIEIALKQLVLSKTISVREGEDIHDLFSTRILSINATIDKDLRKTILNGDFYKKESQHSKLFGILYEPIVEGIKVPESIKETEYDNSWYVEALSKSAIELIAEALRS